jgi:hypothetical protein
MRVNSHCTTVALVALACVYVARAVIADTSTNVVVVGIHRTPNGFVELDFRGPPLQMLLIECSADLATWEPLHWEKDEFGDIAVQLDRLDADGNLVIQDEGAGDHSRRFYRATVL